jgi:hypothetical protein
MMNFIAQLHLTVKSNRLAAQIKQKERHDNTAKQISNRLGQEVMLKIEQTETGLSKKLTPKYKAPYEIIEI